MAGNRSAGLGAAPAAAWLGRVAGRGGRRRSRFGWAPASVRRRCRLRPVPGPVRWPGHSALSLRRARC